MPDVTERVKLLISPGMQVHMETLTKQLVKDQNFRAAFIKNPSASMKDLGIPVDKPFKLRERDKTLINLITDEEIARLYKAGDIAGLRARVVERYPGLSVPDPSRVEDSVADFDVVAEIEAVAVAVVAVAAFAVGDVILQGPERVLELQEMTSVLNARMVALEARVRMLEARR